MENSKSGSPITDGNFILGKINNLKVEQEEDGINCTLERMDIKTEQDEFKHADSSDEQEDKEKNFISNNPSKYLSTENDDYGSLFSQYSSTLYDVAMEAVTQSLLSSRNISSRKKSPAWNHFFISPRDSTKAICMYCMKEFSRGKNEKDLSTSCLMRHVRRAHPTVLIQENGTMPNISSFSSPTLLLPPQSADMGDLSSMLSPIKLVKKMASKIPSPDRIIEESVSIVSSEEIADLSVSEKCNKEEVMVGSSPQLPNNQYDETVENVAEKTVVIPKNTSGSRRRSAVWKHFYLSPLDNSKAVCIHCMNEFSRGKNGKDLGTSCLIRHMWRAHRSIVLQENGGGTSIPPLYTTPPTLLPSLLPSDSDLNSISSSPGKLMKESASVSSSPDRISEEIHTNLSSGDVLVEDSMLSSSDDIGEVSFVSSPEKQCEGLGPLIFEPTAVFQQNKRIMKRLKSEVWHHFSLSPADSLKAVCRYCSCMISRGKKGDVGTSCLMRHLYRRHPDIIGNQKKLS